MLTAYREGLDTSAGIKQVCKVDKATFEKAYREYLDEVVKSIQGKPAEKPMTLLQLQAAYEKAPENLDLAARLAELYAERNRNGDARKLVEMVLAKKKSHPLANYVKAQLLLKAGGDEEARVLLEAALDKEAPEPKIIQLLGKLYFEGKELDKAAEMFELGLKTQPFEAKWLVELARVYTQTGNKPKLIGVLKKLVMTDSDELDQRKRLAKLLLEANRFDEAEKFARQALEINVLNAEVQDMVYQSLVGQGRKDEADKLRKLLEK
jgi:predicted Zn-dependent protease